MKKNYFITAFAIFILLLSIKLHAQTALGSDRMLMVEVFGSNIFAIDEQGGTTYQRQIDLIDYCQSHGIKTLILEKIYKAVNSTIVKGSPLVGIFAHRLCAAGDSDAHSTSVFIEYKFILGFFFH